MINVLPRAQLVAQWRELSAIVGSINKNGTPNHLLVNKVLDYPYSHFEFYSELVLKELMLRKYKPSKDVIKKIFSGIDSTALTFNELYSGWHNEVYLRQCLYNLEEKAMCGGIPIDEWNKIYEKYGTSFHLQKN